jgi:hypothetical protein
MARDCPRGNINAIGPRLIEGWIQDVAHPEASVCLDIYVDGHQIGQTLADLYREDLRRAGIGSGRHAFAFTLPDGDARHEAIRHRWNGEGRKRQPYRDVRADLPGGKKLSESTLNGQRLENHSSSVNPTRNTTW